LDLAAILSTLEPGDVLFIDEIHRLPKQVEEVLYPAMEDYCLDIVVGKDTATTHNIRLSLPPFTLVGATTRAGDLSAPLRDRFGIVSQLEYYSLEELSQIVARTARVMNTDIELDAVREVALRSRGTPRIANRLFRRVRDFAQVYNEGTISLDVAKDALDRLQVDELGLDRVDHKYLHGIIERFKGGPVGLEALASSIGEEATTIEDVYEPYLLQIGFIERTPRGRRVTIKAKRHLGNAGNL
ncbi:Holliday junction branch migration DNA helicase RuvB, partial [Candidatus Nanosynsacchari sp. TM7_ANC_38.39_G1_1]|uniref:Holliday junction branch migration DNA helicase RuvB n=1 Tax=Candidatus Nanosynsacchari sp. TM7_ANC_38.39_G1_1 TaxID=1986206 RepID=UPI00101D923D